MYSPPLRAARSRRRAGSDFAAAASTWSGAWPVSTRVSAAPKLKRPSLTSSQASTAGSDPTPAREDAPS